MIKLLFFLFSLLLLPLSYGEVSGIDLGKQALKQGFSRKAYEHLEKVELSTLSSDEEKDSLALSRVEAALKIGESCAEDLEYLAKSENPKTKEQLKFWIAIQSLQKFELNLALTQLIELTTVESHPYRNEIILNLAKLYLELETPSEALNTLNQLSEDTPPEYNLLKAEALIILGEVDNAKAVLETIAESSWRAKVLQASILYNEGSVEQATKLLSATKIPKKSRKGKDTLSFLCLLYCETINTAAYPLIQELITTSSADEPISDYFDLLLLATQMDEDYKAETLIFLQTLKSENKPWIKPYALFKEAELTDSPEQRIEILSELYKSKTSPQLNAKACYTAAKLAFQLSDKKASIAKLQEIITFCELSSLQAKIYSWVAERSDLEDKPELYKKALTIAALEQEASLKLNLSLSEFINNDKSSVELSATKERDLLIEKALYNFYSAPEKSILWLEQFLTKGQDHPREGEAHFLLAQLLLNSEDRQIQKQAIAHLDTVKTLYKGEVADDEAFFLASVKVASLSDDKTALSKLIKDLPNEIPTLIKAGKALFETGAYFEASNIFKKVHSLSDEPRIQNLLNLYIALSHLEIGTNAHIDDALERLNELSKLSDENLKEHALQTLATYHFKLAEIEQCLRILNKLEPNTYRKIMKAKALALTKDSDYLKEAREIFTNMYRSSNIPSQIRYEIAILLATFLEDHQKEAEALDLYYEIVTFEVLPKPTTNEEWDFFKILGDSGVTLLLESGQEKTAYRYIKLITATDSPHKEYFTKKADELSLKNILWDE